MIDGHAQVASSRRQKFSLLHSLVAALVLLATTTGARAAPPGSELVRMALVEPAYRSGIFSTQPNKRIVARLTHFDPPLKRVLAKVTVMLRGPTGKPLAEAVLDEVGQEAIFDAAGLAPGRYAVTFGTAAGGTIEQSLIVHVWPPSPSEVYLDAEGVCFVNGERFFPLGLYHVGNETSSLNKDNEAAGEPALTEEDTFRMTAQKGFNTVVTVDTQHQYLDLAAKHGLRVLQFASMGGGEVEQSVRLRKAHPALLGWSLNDEPQLDVIVRYELLDRYIQCRKFDPYHPVWVAQHSDFVHGVFTYDILATEHYHWDIMTIGDNGRLSVLPGTGGQVQRARAAVRPGQAVWLVTQAMGGDVYVVVSPHELRNRHYQAIVGGARGILIFTYTFGERMPDGRQFRLDLHCPDVWEACGRINAELRGLMPMLLAPGGEYQLEIEGAPDIRYLKREHEGRLYIIAVNHGPKPQRFELELPSNRARARLVSEDRAIPVKDGRLAHWIDLFGANVYEIE